MEITIPYSDLYLVMALFIREAITNAICHRDYRINSNVQIRIFDDRMEIWGCGPFPEPKDLADKGLISLKGKGRCAHYVLS